MPIAPKPLSWYCVKIVRTTGWILVPFILAYMASGYAMSGKFGMDRFMDTEAAMKLHSSMDLPFGIVIVCHVIPSLYLAIWRRRSRGLWG